MNLKSIKDYNVTSSNFKGASWKTYSPVDPSKDKRDAWDALDSFHTNRPYLV